MRYDLLRWARPAAAAVVLAGLTACLSSNPPVVIRYFDPTPAATASPVQRRELELARVVAAPHLDQRMLWRLSDVEIGYDERHRWISSPADLVESALRGHMQTGESGGPRLSVRVVAFEADEASGEAVLELACTMEFQRNQPVAHERVSVREALDGDSVEDVARALGKALSTAAQAIATWEPEPPGS